MSEINCDSAGVPGLDPLNQSDPLLDAPIELLTVKVCNQIRKPQQVRRQKIVLHLGPKRLATAESGRVLSLANWVTLERSEATSTPVASTARLGWLSPATTLTIERPGA